MSIRVKEVPISKETYEENIRKLLIDHNIKEDEKFNRETVVTVAKDLKKFKSFLRPFDLDKKSISDTDLIDLSKYVKPKSKIHPDVAPALTAINLEEQNEETSEQMLEQPKFFKSYQIFYKPKAKSDSRDSITREPEIVTVPDDKNIDIDNSDKENEVQIKESIKSEEPEEVNVEVEEELQSENDRKNSNLSKNLSITSKERKSLEEEYVTVPQTDFEIQESNFEEKEELKSEDYRKTSNLSKEPSIITEEEKSLQEEDAAVSKISIRRKSTLKDEPEDATVYEDEHIATDKDNSEEQEELEPENYRKTSDLSKESSIITEERKSLEEEHASASKTKMIRKSTLTPEQEAAVVHEDEDIDIDKAITDNRKPESIKSEDFVITEELEPENDRKISNLSKIPSIIAEEEKSLEEEDAAVSKISIRRKSTVTQYDPELSTVYEDEHIDTDEDTTDYRKLESVKGEDFDVTEELQPEDYRKTSSLQPKPSTIPEGRKSLEEEDVTVPKISIRRKSTLTHEPEVAPVYEDEHIDTDKDNSDYKPRESIKSEDFDMKETISEDKEELEPRRTSNLSKTHSIASEERQIYQNLEDDIVTVSKTNIRRKGTVTHEPQVSTVYEEEYIDTDKDITDYKRRESIKSKEFDLEEAIFEDKKEIEPGNYGQISDLSKKCSISTEERNISKNLEDKDVPVSETNIRRKSTRTYEPQVSTIYEDEPIDTDKDNTDYKRRESIKNEEFDIKETIFEDKEEVEPEHYRKISDSSKKRTVSTEERKISKNLEDKDLPLSETNIRRKSTRMYEPQVVTVYEDENFDTDKDNTDYQIRESIKTKEFDVKEAIFEDQDELEPETYRKITDSSKKSSVSTEGRKISKNLEEEDVTVPKSSIRRKSTLTQYEPEIAQVYEDENFVTDKDKSRESIRSKEDNSNLCQKYIEETKLYESPQKDDVTPSKTNIRRRSTLKYEPKITTVYEDEHIDTDKNSSDYKSLKNIKHKKFGIEGVNFDKKEKFTKKQKIYKTDPIKVSLEEDDVAVYIEFSGETKECLVKINEHSNCSTTQSNGPSCSQWESQDGNLQKRDYKRKHIKNYFTDQNQIVNWFNVKKLSLFSWLLNPKK